MAGAFRGLIVYLSGMGLVLLLAAGQATAQPPAEPLPPLAPPDALQGPPFVTAQGWVIGDGRTGRPLYGHEADVPRKSASTTKIMCAYVVLRLADEQPAVLDEQVTFSQLADDTPGSTADIRAGESLSVAECLYALLLPSGNDAGNALAEHFNDRFAPPDGGAAPSATMQTRYRFIAQMNRTARELGMQHTTYRLPYGDGGTATDTTSSPADLLLLASHALRHPVLSRYVATRRRDTEVTTPDGSTRPVGWTNTNQLLGIVGYDGVKTGTSPTAGACLVGSGRRGEDHLIVVVLGSAHPDARYTDIRNLFRYGWQQLGHRE